MCYGRHQSLSADDRAPPFRSPRSDGGPPVETLRGRLEETEARLELARAREAELTQRLEEMKRFVSVMEILEGYLSRRFLEERDSVAGLFVASFSPDQTCI